MAQFTAVIHAGAQLFGPTALPASNGLVPSYLTNGYFDAWVSLTSGDVVGPDSSTDNAIVRWDGVTGALTANSVVVITDLGAVTGVTDLTATGNITVSGTVDGRDVAVDGTKLDGIEASATADQTGAEIKALYELEASAFTDAQFTKLSGIETGADVTDTANVTAAGALMDSEVDADLKTLALPASTTISTFGASLVDDATAAAARTTLGVDAAGTDNSSLAVKDEGSSLHVAATEFNFVGSGVTATNVGSVITVTVAGGGAAPVDSVNTQTGVVVLDADDISDAATTNKYTTAGDITKLSGIETSATADQTGAEIKALYEAEANAFTDAQFTKLSGIEASADVTDEANVNASGAVMEADTTTASMSFVVDEDTMVSDLDTKVPTQQSVKAYVDTAVTSGMTYKGGYNAATNTPDLDTSASGVEVGDTYTVTVAGTFFTVEVEIGDQLLANQDAATSEAHWAVVQSNLTPAQIKVQYESNADTNEFSDAEQTKLSGIEASATADQTGAEIKALYEAEANAFTDAQFTKLAGVETGADVTDEANVAATASVIANTAKVTNATHTGDVTGSTVLTIAADAVTLDMMADISTATILGRTTASTGTVEVLTAAGVRTLLNVEDGADVTDTASVTAAGALMDSEVTNLSQVKAFDSSNYATAAQGTKADSAQQPPTEGAFVDGDKTKLDGIEASATADQTDAEIRTAVEAATDSNVFTDADHSKLNAIEAAADVTDTANVTAAGALMDSELINTTAGVGDAGKAIKLDSSGVLDSSFYTDTDTTDHTALTNIGTNTHAQIDTHIADATQHFAQGSISITASQVSDFDTEVSNNASVTANTAKITNATHTGDVTGDTALTIAAGAVDIAMLANGTDGELITWDAAGAPSTVAVGTATHVLTSNGAGAAPTFQAAAGGGSGDVVGPASATNNALARFDATTGKLVQNSVGILTDAGALSGLTDITVPGLGARSEHFGATSYASTADSTAVGYFAHAITGAETTALGASTDATGTSATAVGYLAQATGLQSGTHGAQSTTSGAYSTSVGTHISNIHDYSICLGHYSVSQDHNALNLGGRGNAAHDVSRIYFGHGCTSAYAGVTPARMSATSGVGTNTSGTNLELTGGQPTGSANGGSVRLLTAPPGASGGSLRALQYRLTVDTNGDFDFHSNDLQEIGSASGTNGSGTNSAGSDLVIAGGRPTGSGAGGSVSLKTAAAGASGSTLRALVEHMEIREDGLILLPTIPETDPEVEYALYNDAGYLAISAGGMGGEP